jgi:hypothetical protein
MAVNLDLKATTNNNDLYAVSLVVDVSAFQGTLISPTKATMMLMPGTPVVTGTSKVLSPTTRAMVITRSTPTLKFTFKFTPATMAMVLSPGTPTVTIAPAVTTQMVMII